MEKKYLGNQDKPITPREQINPENFSDEQKAEIAYKLRILSTLANFIGKDFQMPVKLNEPGEGWKWNFEENIVYVDPLDLLTKSMNELRYVICHEGGHRRISKPEVIPEEIIQQPGFLMMMNAIEDPRNNNFVAEVYPRFADFMRETFRLRNDEMKKNEELARKNLGRIPRFMQATFEYIKMWFREIESEEMKITDSLPQEVKDAVSKTLSAAKDSWWRYPTREEADASEEIIISYADASYVINRDEIWPEFKKLVDLDVEDQKTQEELKNQTKKSKKSGKPEIPKELEQNLTPEEKKELEDAIKEAMKDGDEKGGEKKEEGQESEGEKGEGEGSEKQQPSKPIDMDKLSEELKKKIKEYIDGLPEDEKRKLEEKAKKAIKDFEKKVNEDRKAKMPDKGKKPEEQKDRKGKKGKITPEGKGDYGHEVPEDASDPSGLKAYKDRIKREIEAPVNLYMDTMKELMPLIDQLTQSLMRVFKPTISGKWQTGYTTGKRVDISKRIQEKVKSVPVTETESWQRRDRPVKIDAAMVILVDLSGSMRQNEVIKRTYEGLVVLIESLNKLGVDFEVIGFNDELYEYKTFSEKLSSETRKKMSNMYDVVKESCCGGCGNEHSETDIGWATKQALERLRQKKSSTKILYTFSEGEEAPGKHGDDQLADVLLGLNDDEKTIGLGLGRGTSGIGNFYEDSLTETDVRGMVKNLPSLLNTVISS